MFLFFLFCRGLPYKHTKERLDRTGRQQKTADAVGWCSFTTEESPREKNKELVNSQLNINIPGSQKQKYMEKTINPIKSPTKQKVNVYPAQFPLYQRL